MTGSAMNAATVPGSSARGAVIRRPARDDLPASGVAARDVILARELDRGLRRLGAAGHEEESRVLDGRPLGHLDGERLDGLGRQLAAVHVGEPARLIRDRVRDLDDAVPDTHDDGAARGVQQATALLVPEVCTFASNGGGEIPAGALPAEDGHGPLR
jgi:hypothetical protein